MKVVSARESGASRPGGTWITLSPRAVRALGYIALAGALALPVVARWQGVLRARTPEDVKPRALRPALIELPGGSFLMGTPADEPDRDGDEGPRHQVTVSAFAICQTEITQGQWEAVMGENPSDCYYGCGDDLPVQTVTWVDVMRYMNALTERENAARAEGDELTPCYEIEGDRVRWRPGCSGYRLPTEAEWEYAARAGTQTVYSFGDDPGKLEEYAWYEANAERKVHPVGEKKANAWGLHDVHGNAWEWVWDEYGSYQAESRSDPRGPASEADPGIAFTGTETDAMRVLRGGSFEYPARVLRSGYRLRFRPWSRLRHLGARCARSLPPALTP